ncbi:MAG TPA: energy transducer TonB [Candidatus Sulfotelmatobacter sp.]|nr:energy transducer TonB [Candidatus Sulfotelmatobacter sp.]
MPRTAAHGPRFRDIASFILCYVTLSLRARNWRIVNILRTLVLLPLIGGTLYAQTSPTAPSSSVPPAPEVPFTVKILRSVPAQYPPDAIAKHTQGTISVTAVVLPTGAVERAEAADGDSILQQAAITATKQYRFRASKGPIKCWAQLIFDFRLSDAATGALPVNQQILGQLVHAEEFPTFVRVSELAMEKTRIKVVGPNYPHRGPDPVAEGTVVLKAHIGTDGKVQDVHLIYGPPKLEGAAEDAVRQWEYKPYVIMGEAVPVETEITMKFGGPSQHPLPEGALEWMTQNPGSVVQQTEIHEASALYPEAARPKGLHSVVVMATEIDANGKLNDLHVVDGDPLFNQAALQAATAQFIVPHGNNSSGTRQVAIVVRFVK